MEIPAAASSFQPVRDKSPIRSVIIIGTGLAGLRTASALRDQGFTGEITILGTEPHLPYDRPPLSKKLLAHSEPVFFHDDLGLILHDLTPLVYSGWTVTGLELSNGDSGQSRATVTAIASEASSKADAAAVSDPSPKQFTADAVVFAVGSAPVVPSGWAGTHKLYTWEDAQKLRAALTKSPHQDVVIIGAGWIGAELATVAADAGHQVTVVEAQETALAAQLGPEIGAITASWYRDLGIELLSATSVDRVLISPNSKRKVHLTPTAHTAGRSLSADIVITAVGARPATSWLPASFPRTATGALQTDQWGRVNLAQSPGAHVYAVGDCAERQDAVFTTVPGGHWNTALQDPDRVAAAITGAYTLTRAHAPQVFSTQLGHEINLFGLPNVATDHVLIRPSATAGGQDWVGLYVAPQAPQGSEAQEAPAGSAAVTDPNIRTVTGIFTVDSPRLSSQARKLMAGGPVQLDITKALDPTVQLRMATAN